MGLILQALAHLIVATTLAGLLAGLIFSQTLAMDSTLLRQSVWTMSVWSLYGFFIQAFMTERWIRPLLRLRRTLDKRLPASEESNADMLDAVRFPIRSMFLSMSLWAVVSIASLIEIRSLNHIEDRMSFLVVATILLTVGGWAWTLQLFLNRRMVTKHVEKFLVYHQNEWSTSDPSFGTPMFPLRAKWLMISMFIVGMTSILGSVYTAGNLQDSANAVLTQQKTEQLESLLPIVSTEITMDSSIPPSGILISQELFRRSNTVTKLNHWIDVPFWVFDRFGQELYASDPDLSRKTNLVRSRLVRRELNDDFFIEILPLQEEDVARTSMYLILFAYVVVLTGVIVLIVAVAIGQDLATSLKQLHRIASTYSQGDFSAVPLIASDDDLGAVAVNMLRIRSTLTEVVDSLQQASEIFRESNDDLNVSTSSLIHSTSEQKRNILKVEHMLEELEEVFQHQTEEIVLLEGRVGKARRASEDSELQLTGMDSLSSQLIEQAENLTTSVEHIQMNTETHQRSIQAWIAFVRDMRKRTMLLANRLEKQREAVSNIVTDQQRQIAILDEQRIEFNRTARSVDHVTHTAQGMVALLNKVRSSVDMMDEAIGWVNEIGDDTRLLSLNAAILSAQAEKEGRSFSVIAQNIESLADHSDQSVRGIEKAILDLEGFIDTLQEESNTFFTQSDAVSTLTGKVVADDLAFQKLLETQMTVTRELERGIYACAEIVRAVLTNVESVSRSLDSVESHLGTQHYRFDEIRELLGTVVSRISEIKGHSQYQAGRSSTIWDHLEQIVGMLRDIGNMAESYLEESQDLVEFSKYIRGNIENQAACLTGVSSRVTEFEKHTRVFVMNLDAQGAGG